MKIYFDIKLFNMNNCVKKQNKKDDRYYEINYKVIVDQSRYTLNPTINQRKNAWLDVRV